MASVLFFVLAAACVVSVSAMLISRNPAHNALFLAAAFTALGGVFGLMNAPFVAVVQVIIYAGAIMVLFLFVIMAAPPQERLPKEKRKWTRRLAAILGAALAVEILLALKKLLASPAPLPAPIPQGEAGRLGELLFGRYIYAFEITSLLIVAALVGALVLAGKEDNG